MEKITELVKKFLTDADLLTVGLLVLFVHIILPHNDLLTYGVFAWYVLKKVFTSLSKQVEDNAMENKILKAIQDGVGSINMNTNARIDSVRVELDAKIERKSEQIQQTLLNIKEDIGILKGREKKKDKAA